MLFYRVKDPRYTVTKVIDFPRYNMKCSGENAEYFIVSRFPLLFKLYPGNLVCFSNSVVILRIQILPNVNYNYPVQNNNFFLHASFSRTIILEQLFILFYLFLHQYFLELSYHTIVRRTIVHSTKLFLRETFPTKLFQEASLLEHLFLEKIIFEHSFLYWSHSNTAMPRTTFLNRLSWNMHLGILHEIFCFLICTTV